MSSKYLRNFAVKKKRTEKMKRRDGTSLLFPIFVSRNSIPLKRYPFKLQKQILNTCNSTPDVYPLTDNSKVFLNLAFNKGILKTFVFWCFVKYGQAKTIKILEKLQLIGFSYATKAGISLSIDDLKIPPIKAMLLTDAEKMVEDGLLGYKKAQLTGLERFQRVIETWHKTSESLKDEMIDYFRKTDTLNPVYMMAFSGARGNVSQVRQLVSMRGLMSDPQGKILSFPIQSNFREGLTLTEYVISCYGARKGVVDTALRTANAGYLTRRLVDVAQHVIVLNFDCGTKKGIYLTEMTTLHKTLYPLRQRLIGRVLAADIYNVKPNSNKKHFRSKTNGEVIARLNQEISEPLAQKIAKLTNKVLIRSPLTCATPRLVCQLCYGWSLSEGYLVSIGEAVGIIAAQSIGEPGTQLTMRTFHTGGVFSGEMFDQLIAPYDAIVTYSAPVPGTLIRTTQGKIAFLIKAEGLLSIAKCENLESNVSSHNSFEAKKSFKLPPYTVLFLRHNEKVLKDQLIAELAFLSSKVAQKSETAEFIVKSELEGQIYNGSITLFEKYTNYNDLITQSKDWGTVWLLSGKICQLPLNSTFFALPGDLVDETSVLSEVKWFVPVKTLLDTNSVIKPIKKEIFYDFSLNKNKWSDSSSFFSFSVRRKSVFLSFAEKKRVEKKLRVKPINQKGKKKLAPIRKKLFNCKNPIMNDYSLLNKLKIKLNSVENIAINSDGRDKAGFHNPKRISEQLKNFNAHVSSVRHSRTELGSFASPSSSFTNKSGIENAFSIKNKINITFPLLLINFDRISYKRFGYFFSFVANSEKKLKSQFFCFGSSFFSNDKKLREETKNEISKYFEVANLFVTGYGSERPKSFLSVSEPSADVFFVPKLLEQRTKFWQKNYGPNEISADTSWKKSWGNFQKLPESSLFSSSSPILNSKSSPRLSKDLFHWFPKKYLTLKGGICIYSWNYDSFPHYSNFINNLSLLILFKGFWAKKDTYKSYTKFIENPAKIFWVNQNFSKSKIYKVNVQNKNLVNYNDKVNSYKQIKVSDFSFSSRILCLTSFPFRDVYLSKMNDYYLGLNIWNSSNTLIYKTIGQECSKFSRTGYTTLKSFCLKTKVSRSGMSPIVSTKGFRKANRAMKNLAENPLKRTLHKANRTKDEVSQKKIVLSFSSILRRKNNVIQNLKKFDLINKKKKQILPILNKDLHSHLHKQDLDNTIFLYKIKNLVSAISLHKKLFFPGQKLVDDVSFDSTVVYVQCFPENSIQKEKKGQIEVKSRNANFKFYVKKCISNPRVRFKTIENFSPNFLFKLSESSHFILLIRKIREYSVSQPNYYKKLLYQSKAKKFKSKVCTKIATSNYCSQILNKQSPSLRLLEKYPKIDVVLKLNYKGLKKRQLQTFTTNLENVNFPQNIKNLMVKRSELGDKDRKAEVLSLSLRPVSPFAKNFERPRFKEFEAGVSANQFLSIDKKQTIFSQKNFLTSSNIEFLTKSSVQLLTCKLITRNKILFKNSRKTGVSRLGSSYSKLVFSKSSRFSFFSLEKKLQTKVRVFNELKRTSNSLYIIHNYLDESLIAVLRCQENTFKNWKIYKRNSAPSNKSRFYLWNNRSAIIISTYSQSVFKSNLNYISSKNNFYNMEVSQSLDTGNLSQNSHPFLNAFNSKNLSEQSKSGYQIANSKRKIAPKFLFPNLLFQNPYNLDQAQLSKEQLYFPIKEQQRKDVEFLALNFFSGETKINRNQSSRSDEGTSSFFFSKTSLSFPIYSLFTPRSIEQIEQEMNLIGDLRTASNLSQLERAFAATSSSFPIEDTGRAGFENSNWILASTVNNLLSKDKRFGFLCQKNKNFYTQRFLRKESKKRSFLIFPSHFNSLFFPKKKKLATNVFFKDQSKQSVKSIIETKKNKYYKNHFLNSFSFSGSEISNIPENWENFERKSELSSMVFGRETNLSVFSFLDKKIKKLNSEKRNFHKYIQLVPKKKLFVPGRSKDFQATDAFLSIQFHFLFNKNKKNRNSVLLQGQIFFSEAKKKITQNSRFEIKPTKLNKSYNTSDVKNTFNYLFDHYLPTKKRTTIYNFDTLQINPNTMSQMRWESNCYFNYAQKYPFSYRHSKGWNWLDDFFSQSEKKTITPGNRSRWTSENKNVRYNRLFSTFLSIFNKTSSDLQYLPDFKPSNGGYNSSVWDLDFSLLASFFHQPCLYAFFSSQVTFGYNELMLENPYLKFSKKGLKTKMSFNSGFSSEQEELVRTSYLSPFKGEILRHEIYYWSQNTQRNRYLFLTKDDQISFYSENYFQQKALLSQSILPKKLNEELYEKKPIMFHQKLVGEFITKGDYLKLNSENVIISSESGILIHYNKFKITLRKAQSFFLSPNCIFHYAHGDLVDKNQSILSLPYQQLKTGDIVQGIPKVEQLLEARSTFKGKEEEDNLHTLLIYVFEVYKKKFSLKLSVRKAFSFIQLILVNSVQRIYRSQGVNISDKHLEVIVKQMTSKVQITSRGDSSFFRDEYVDLYIVETWNSLHPRLKKICYKPILLGISRSSLEVNSFLSAASFQHTKKVLSRSAFKTNIDFLNGLKENVIIGNLISAGTGILTNNSIKQ